MFGRNLIPGNAVLGQGERGGTLLRIEVVDLAIVDHYHVKCLMHIPSNNVVQCALIYLVYPEQVEMPIKLADNDHSGLIFQLARVSGLLSANIARGLMAVNLGHRSTDSVAKIPRSLIGDSEGSLNLMGAHSVAGFAEQISCNEPLPQRQVCVMEDCAIRHGKLIAA